MRILTRSPGRTGPGAPAEGNGRLTASTSAILLTLFAIEVATVVMGVRANLALHVMVGLLLVPPLLVKMAAVGWRFVRYYRHDMQYRRKGPPAPVLRILGPVLLAITLALFISGITLLLAPGAFGGPRGITYQIHVASFYIWMLLILVHAAGHARDLRRLAPRDWLRRTRAAVPGAVARQAIALASLAAGLALALSLVGHVRTFQNTAHHGGAAGHQTSTAATAQRPQPARTPGGHR